jgi:4-hydroxy-tetrahydrodipicolinate reductase
MTEATKVAVAGAGGRMGQVLIEMVRETPSLRLTAALEQTGAPAVGRDLGEGVIITDDAENALKNADVLIDFTRPGGTLRHAEICAKLGCAMVIGTTGFTEDEKQTLAKLAEKTPMVIASNMSVGVTIMKRLVEQAARLLGPDYDIELVEMHHKHKVDAPSGTSLLLGEAAAKGAGVNLKDHAVFSRHGMTGERPAGAIGFATLRGGDVVGDHTVMFCGEGERVELSHKAGSRRNFAAGALRAAAFLAEMKKQGKNGVYGMDDVIS